MRHQMISILNASVLALERHGVAHVVRRVVPKRISMRVRDLRGTRLVPIDELRRWYGSVLDDLVESGGESSLGDYLEFGVFQGDSLTCMYGALRERALDEVRLFGFDSFEGLPAIAHPEDRKLGWHQGDFSASEERTTRRLVRNGVDMGRVKLVKGFYSDTLSPGAAEGLGIMKASVIMIDCDLYSSAKQALDFCAPLIRDVAVVFFDDWTLGRGDGDKNLGEQRAWAEFLAENPSLTAEDAGTYFHTEREAPVPSKIFRLTRGVA